jgi:mannan endo-1,4-beta-mannosidase
MFSKLAIKANSLLAFMHTSSVNAQPTNFDFVTRTGSTLYEDGKPFKWISYNIPNLLLLEGVQEEWIPPTPFEQESAILAIVGSHGSVARTYTLGFGPHYHMSGPNEYYEPAWIAMDNALALARQHRVRLIIPLINNHNGDDSASMAYGDYGLIAAFRGLKPSAFFTSSVLRSDLKALISHLLNRVNTVNGMRYADDCTILGWELGNELGGWDGPVPPSDWTSDIAAHIKSISPKALVASGDMGGLNAKSQYSDATLTSPLIDLVSNHYYYGDSDLARITSDSALASSHGKAFFIGEFGFASASVHESIYKATLANPAICGALIWSLRYHSREGGFYVHFEKDSQLAYHVPGFKSSPSFNSADEKQMVTLTRKYGLKAQGLSYFTSFMIPPAPRAIDGVTSKKVRFMGSPWAESYRLSRNNGGAGWEIVKDGFTDGVASGTAVFADDVSVSSTGVMYKVEPKSVGGQYGPGLIIGPLYS